MWAENTILVPIGNLTMFIFDRVYVVLKLWGSDCMQIRTFFTVELVPTHDISKCHVPDYQLPCFLPVTAFSVPLLAFQGLQTDMCSLYETWQLNFSPAVDDLLGGRHRRSCCWTETCMTNAASFLCCLIAWHKMKQFLSYDDFAFCRSFTTSNSLPTLRCI